MTISVHPEDGDHGRFPHQRSWLSRLLAGPASPGYYKWRSRRTDRLPNNAVADARLTVTR